MMDLSTQRILVTGASRGIGLAIAKLLLEEGATVGLHYNSTRDSVDALARDFNSSKAIPIKADLSISQDVETLFEQARSMLNGLDSIIINAGIFKPHPIDSSLSDWLEVWNETLKINLESPAVLTKLALEYFKAQKQGRFVYIGSRAASRGETEEYLAYAASKGGITSLARSVARSFGKYNIKAFTIAPGFTKTEMAMDAISQIGVEQVISNTALKQLTLPEHIAPLVALMCRGGMDHATGTTIDINAGSHIH